MFLILNWKQLLTYAQEQIIVSFPAIVVADSAHGDLKVRSPLLLDLISQRMDLETVQSWNKLIGGLLRSILWVNHEQHMWETSSKVCPISMMMAG